MADQPRYAGRISDWILHKDKQVMAFNKPAGLLIQPDKGGEASLLGLAAAYARHNLYPVHRLDRPVGGVVLLAHKPSGQATISKQFKAGTVEKEYLAIVSERPPTDAATITNFLTDGKGNKTLVHDEAGEGRKKASLSYEYLSSNDHYHLLRIQLHSGRKHQIRAQLAHMGCPVYGDVKYGAKRAAPDRSIGLHAKRLAYDHPTSGKRMVHEAPLPPASWWASFAAE